MPISQETLGKLTTSLAGDVELYNEIINTIQESDAQIDTVKQELAGTAQKLQESEARGQGYLGQISNLLAHIPVSSGRADVTVEQKLEEIKNTKWTK